MPKHELVTFLRYKLAKTAWFALLAYKDKLEHDLQTKYDGNPDWSDEDEVFLKGTIQDVQEAIKVLTDQGVTY